MNKFKVGDTVFTKTYHKWDEGFMTVVELGHYFVSCTHPNPQLKLGAFAPSYLTKVIPCKLTKLYYAEKFEEMKNYE